MQLHFNVSIIILTILDENREHFYNHQCLTSQQPLGYRVVLDRTTAAPQRQNSQINLDSRIPSTCGEM